jgi:hypothetical protein
MQNELKIHVHDSRFFCKYSDGHMCGLGEKFHTKFYAISLKETDPVGAGANGEMIVRVLK